MYRSFIEKKPVGMDAKSIASGLAPPSAGTIPVLSIFFSHSNYWRIDRPWTVIRFKLGIKTLFVCF